MNSPSLDRITNDFINKLLFSYELESSGIAKDFELFSSYCALKQNHSGYLETTEIQNSLVGATGDTGIDSIAVILENKLVQDIDEIDETINDKEAVQLCLVFVQASTSKTFDSKKFREFTIGVKEFFYDYTNPDKIKTKKRNKSVENKSALVCKLLKETSSSIERPKCKLYYFIGNDVESKLGVNQDLINSEKQALEDLNLFGSIDIQVKGTSFLHHLYRQTLAKPKVQISFPHKVTLPLIDGVEESYIGRINFKEFRKLIIDDTSGNIRNVFEDNVRYFNEDYKINNLIKNTIKSDNIDKFALLNNGVTVVTKKMVISSDYLTLEDYQIVNGCQTSHVLFNCRNHEKIDDLWLILKIIKTDDQFITNEITAATNNQTPVKIENLNSLLQFHRKLEQYYDSSTYKSGKEDISLFYERQEGKYDKNQNIKRSRIISIKDQIKSFAAMFLDVPHESYGFYGQRLIERKMEDNIFQNDHLCEPYYTSSVVNYELSKYLNKKSSPYHDYRIYKFHILTMIKYLILGSNVPEVNNGQIKSSCEKILGSVQKKRTFEKCIDQSISIIKNELVKENSGLENDKTLKQKSFAEKLISASKEKDRSDLEQKIDDCDEEESN
jgi:uncharacterized ubiquitin-like protein YukD